MKRKLSNSYKRLPVVIAMFSSMIVTTAIEVNRLQLEEQRNIPVVSAYEELPRQQPKLDEKETVINDDVNLEAVDTRRLETYKKVESYNIPCEYVYDEEMPEGNVQTVQEAKDGVKEVTFLASYEESEEIDAVPIESEILEEAVPMIIHIGTKKPEQFITPVTSYVLTSTFGPRWGRNHNGVDLAVSEGTSVMASAPGTVVQEGWNGGYGISVYIDHGNGFYTRYGHLSETNVVVGQYVSQGDIIAYSGNTGDSTGPHLHFEIREGDEPVDPMEYVYIE